VSHYVALVHHPVVDQTGAEVTTALTNLDLHDIARSCRTYGVAGYFIVHPVESQRQMVQRIVGHWETDPRHDFRRAALELVHAVPTLQHAIDAIAIAAIEPRPFVIATTARRTPGAISFAAARQASRDEARPTLLVLGTGFGLADSIMKSADAILDPIVGPTAYNHLSVRSACAILLDRLYGIDESLPPR
jgi:hypothetical protein